MEEGLKQMSSVQDHVMKKTEQYVDQLTIGNNSYYVIITSSLMMSLYSSSVTTANTDAKNYNRTTKTNS